MALKTFLPGFTPYNLSDHLTGTNQSKELIMTHPLTMLRDRVSGAIERGEAQPVRGIPHPVFTLDDLTNMCASELLYFTDAPLAHAAAYEDYLRVSTIEKRWARERRVNHADRLWA